MARPEDTLARGAGRPTGGFEPTYDEGLQGQRRSEPRLADPRAPMRGPSQTGIPLAPDPQGQPRVAQPGATPRFDPYLPQGNPAPPRQPAAEPPRTYADPRQSDPRLANPNMNGRQDPRLDFPPQGQQPYTQDPYQAPRAPQGAAPNGQRAPQQAGAPQQQVPPTAPPMAERRYAAPAAGERGAPVRQGTQGRPGQTQRPVANGYAPPAATPQQDIMPPTRGRDPYLDSQSKRPPLAAPNGAQVPARQQSYGYAQDGYGQESYSETAETEAADDDYEADDAEDDYADDTPPRGRRGLYVLAALVVAIAIGGGLGYAYKLSVGSGVKSGVRVLQADKAPSKTIPADAGGQTFDTGKKTILDRAGETPEGATTMVSNQEQVATSTEGNANGQTGNVALPRKVSTVVVTPGQPIEASVSTGSGAAREDQGVPGISLGEPDASPAAKPAKAPDAAALKAKMKAATQKATDVVDQGTTAAGDVAADAQAVAAEAAQQPAKLAGAKMAAVKKAVKVAAADPLVDPAAGGEEQADPAAAATAPAAKTKLAPAAAAAAKTGAGGYILQVFSGKSQAESLAYFADMQQKFGEIIGSGQPDIQEVDLGAQGKKYRLRIGPAASGAAVKSMCSKLKASGLKDCIVAAN